MTLREGERSFAFQTPPGKIPASKSLTRRNSLGRSWRRRHSLNLMLAAVDWVGESVAIIPIRIPDQTFSQLTNGLIMIRLQTQRFGTIERPEEAVLNFPGGIFGFELSRRWLLLRDREHGSLFWLQSVDHLDLSLSAVDPREFISGYSLRIDRAQLDHVWTENEPLVVLSVLTQFADRLVVNLRNPLVINPELSSGRQVVTSDDQPIHYELPTQSISLKQSA